MPYRSHCKLTPLRSAFLCALLVALLVFGCWVKSVFAYDTRVPNPPVPRPPVTWAGVRGYDLKGKLIYFGFLREEDCVPSVDACRTIVDIHGGGLCKVRPGSLKLHNVSLTHGPYSERTKIAVE
jgi:hypothetical protein